MHRAFNNKRFKDHDLFQWRRWWAPNPPNRRGTDPYAQWCGRGGIVRCPSIPIDDDEHNATLDRSGIEGCRGSILMKTDMRSYGGPLVLYDIKRPRHHVVQPRCVIGWLSKSPGGGL